MFPKIWREAWISVVKHFSRNTKNRCNVFPEQLSYLGCISLPRTKMARNQLRILGKTVNNGKYCVVFARSAWGQIGDKVHTVTLETCFWDRQGVKQTRSKSSTIFRTLTHRTCFYKCSYGTHHVWPPDSLWQKRKRLGCRHVTCECACMRFQ